jgi:hypothetical protein
MKASRASHHDRTGVVDERFTLALALALAFAFAGFSFALALALALSRQVDVHIGFGAPHTRRQHRKSKHKKTHAIPLKWKMACVETR